MNKEVYEAALERAGGLYCEICGSNVWVELHHIIGGNGKRKSCERLETVIFLCYHHHRGNQGAHNSRKLNMDLKRLASERLQEAGLEGDDLKQALGGRFYW